MLDDAAIERYSRQILLPEVGGRGQERLCATSVVVLGDDAASAFATALLVAAGVRVVGAGGPPGRLATTLAPGAALGRTCGGRAVVATLIGRPCARCVPDAIWGELAGGLPADGGAHAQAVGALVAAETLRLALGLATAGRVQVVDLGAGTFAGHALAASEGCSACTRAS